MILIYSASSSNRLTYVLDFVFKEHGLTYKLTSDVSFYQSYTDYKFAYSSDEVFSENEKLKPATLLFEKGIVSQKIERCFWKNTPCLSFEGVYDPLASIFYVLTRYEEYVGTVRDEHNRFEAKTSVLSKYEWLQIQVVERWIEALLLHFAPPIYEKLKQNLQRELIPTFDIDITFAHLWKGNARNFLSACKDLSRLNIENINIRRAVLQGQLKDPYDSFDEILSIAEQFTETRVFWHIGAYGKYDKNISVHDVNHQKLIQVISEKTHLGLHPSYASNTSYKKLEFEAQSLRDVSQKQVNESRQHFLKLSFPETYLNLIQLNFEKDYSMGYADQIGFRAGTAHPHSFYDVLNDMSYENYRIVPFCYMDGTLKDYLNLNCEESIVQIQRLMAEVKEYGGVFSFIWHNHSFAEADSWSGWKKVFNETIRLWNELK